MTNPAEQAEEILDGIKGSMSTDQALNLANAYAVLAQSDALLEFATALREHARSLNEASARFTKMKPLLQQPEIDPATLEAMEQLAARTPHAFHVIPDAEQSYTHVQRQDHSTEQASPRYIDVDVQDAAQQLRQGQRVLLHRTMERQLQQHMTNAEWDALEWVAATEGRYWYTLGDVDIPEQQGEQAVTWDEEDPGHPLDASIPVEAPGSTTGPNTPPKARVKKQQRPQKPTDGAKAPQQPQYYFPPQQQAMSPRALYDSVNDLMSGRTVHVRSRKSLDALTAALPQGMQGALTYTDAEDAHLTGYSYAARILTVPSEDTLKALESELGLPPGVIRDPDPDNDASTGQDTEIPEDETP